MSETPITRRDSQKTWDNLPVTETHVFNMQPFHGKVLQMGDVHFHFNSAVVLPDYGADFPPHGQPVTERTTALAIIAEAIRYANSKTDNKTLIAGHTDTVGGSDFNLKLSKERAMNIYYVIMGMRDEWVADAAKHNKVEDYQQILKWINWLWDADCDPGDVDNVNGPQTKAAVKSMQTLYNNEFGDSPDYTGKIGVDGIVGPETWGAIFDIYIEYLLIGLETDKPGLEAMRQKINYLTDEPVGCGKNFPIEKPHTDNFPSATNRRVEILFFDPDQVPRMLCHPGPTACVPKICEVYDSKMYKFTPIPVPPIVVTRPRQWVVQLLVMDQIKERKPGDKINYVPLANMDYEVNNSGGADPIKGKTNANGEVRIPVVSDPALMSLTVGQQKMVFALDAGHLGDVHDTTVDLPVENRLYNLGFGTSAVQTGLGGPEYVKALHDYETEQSLPQNDQPDDALRSSLETVHGG